MNSTLPLLIADEIGGDGAFQPLRHYVPPPLYFAMQNTEEEVNTFLYIMLVLLPCRVP